MDVALRCDDIWFSHRGGPDVLRGVNLEAHEATVTALVGPNGCGKSTLIRCLTDLWRPRRGQASWWGTSVTSLPRRERARRIAYLPQSVEPTFPVSVLDVVLLGRYPHTGGHITEHDVEVATSVLERLGLLSLADRAIGTLSGGQRQLAMLGRCLAQEPDVLILDEPTSAMDLRHVLETMQQLRRSCAEGVTVIAALHDLASAARFADQLAVMAEGRVVAQGPPDDVLTDRMLAEVYGVVGRVTRTGEHMIVLADDLAER